MHLTIIRTIHIIINRGYVVSHFATDGFALLRASSINKKPSSRTVSSQDSETPIRSKGSNNRDDPHTDSVAHLVDKHFPAGKASAVDDQAVQAGEGEEGTGAEDQGGKRGGGQRGRKGKGKRKGRGRKGKRGGGEEESNND